MTAQLHLHAIGTNRTSMTILFKASLEKYESSDHSPASTAESVQSTT